MLLPVAFGALPPEVNVFRLTTGPGEAPTLASAAAYLVVAQTLAAAAAATDGSMTQMGATYSGPSSDQAQSAFRHHATWLREQSAVAGQASTLLATAASQYAAARSAMVVVGTALAANKLVQVTLIATNTLNQNLPAIALNEAAYLAIWGQAAGVMASYASAVIPTLAALPPPIVAPPIVSGGSPDLTSASQSPVPVPQGGVTSNAGSPKATITGSGNNIGNSASDLGNSASDLGDSASDLGNSATDPTQPTTDPTQSPSDLDQSMSPTDSAANPGMDGTGETSVDQQGFYGTSPDSTTLAGLNGGVGSLVALGMLRGGLGSMPGASTGFRMPSNWLRGPGTAFGAGSNPVTTGPATQGAARRGVSAAAGRRRRRRDEERKPGKVFVPGEQYDIPVLEKAPVIGVIEYTDGEHREESGTEHLLLVGVIERADDESAVAEPERPR